MNLLIIEYIKNNLKSYSNNLNYNELSESIILNFNFIKNEISKIENEEIKKKNLKTLGFVFIISNYIINNNHLYLKNVDSFIYDFLVEIYNINSKNKSFNSVLKFNKIETFDILSLLFDELVVEDKIKMLEKEELFIVYNNLIDCYDSTPIKIQFQKDNDNAIIPTKGDNKSSNSGYDLTIISKYKKLGENTFLYDTGIKVKVPLGFYTMIAPRSSISKTGYILSNNIGIIDNSYRGNLLIALTKIDNSKPDLELPLRIGQLIIMPFIHTIAYEVSNISENETSRGAGGFGSTN